MGNGDWGLEIGDRGLGIGDWRMENGKWRMGQQESASAGRGSSKPIIPIAPPEPL